MQFVERREWIPCFDIDYLPRRGRHLGAVHPAQQLHHAAGGLGRLGRDPGRVAQYMAAFLIMSGLINGAFASLDGILFYVFFEAMLIPMYLIIGIWGGTNRVYAAIKFFLYTLLGSLLMLVALIYLYQSREASRSSTGTTLPLALDTQILIFVAFFAGVRGQGADVAGAHVAAGCAPRGAHGRLGGAGCDHAEDRRVRLRRASSCRSSRTRAAISRDSSLRCRSSRSSTSASWRSSRRT